jgi:hypothetical protein
MGSRTKQVAVVTSLPPSSAERRNDDLETSTGDGFVARIWIGCFLLLGALMLIEVLFAIWPR